MTNDVTRGVQDNLFIGGQLRPAHSATRIPVTDPATEQGREHGTVSPVRPRARDLPTQHQDLRFLGGVTARQERQPAEHADHEQVDEADEHERRS